MPLIGTFTFYLRRRAQVKTRTVSIQLLNGQQVPIIWFRFLVQANSDIFPFSENISKSNDRWVKQLPTWSLEISFTGKNSDNFSYFRKHQWIDFFIIIIASSLSKLMRILAESVLTPLKARIFINFVHMMRILAESVLTPLKARIFIYHQLSGFLSNYNKQ